MTTNTWTDHELDAIQDAEHREAAWSTEDLPQTGGRVVLLQKTGPAFKQTVDINVVYALTAAGDVLNAIDREVVADLRPAWDRLLWGASVSVVRLPAEPVGFWPSSEVVWADLRARVTLALCCSGYSNAQAKWEQADAAIASWVRHHRDCLAKELDSETNLSDYDLSEDGPADPAHLASLRARIDTYTRFLAGLR